MWRTYWASTRLAVHGPRTASLYFNEMATTRLLGTLTVSVASNGETESLKDAKFGQCLIRQIVEDTDALAGHGVKDTRSDLPETVSRQLDSLDYFEWEKVYVGIDPRENGVVLSKTRQETSLDNEEDASIELPIGHASECPALYSSVDSDSSTIKLAVAVVVRSQEGYIMLTQRNAAMNVFPGFWVVPGGHVDPEESLKAAGIREVQEETGITLSSAQLSPLCMWESCFPISVAKGQLRKQHLVVYFEAQIEQSIKNTNVKLEESEVQRLCWIPMKQGQPVFETSMRGVLNQKGEPDPDQGDSIASFTAKGTKFACDIASIASKTVG